LERWLFYLQASRPGLWFQTLWLYLLPVAAVAHERPYASWTFWLGAAYVLFPLNFLVYGWNDFVDMEVDRLNPRKGNFLFGARGTPRQLAWLPKAIAKVNAPFFAIFCLLGGWPMAVILFGIVLTLFFYNSPQHGLRGRPPWELLNQLGYLLILPFAIVLNQTPWLPWPSVLYLVLFCTHAHLMGEIMDVYPDRAAGRRTLATVLGIIPVKAGVMALVLIEAGLITALFRDFVLGGFLFLGAAFLLFDIAVFRERSYTHNQFLLFGLGLNAAGFGSMAWVWFSGTLTRIPH
jgi:4-hydroxybenzoate polyprenyltransferase